MTVGYFSATQLPLTGSSEVTEVKTQPCSPSYPDAVNLGLVGRFVRKGLYPTDRWLNE